MIQFSNSSYHNVSAGALKCLYHKNTLFFKVNNLLQLSKGGFFFFFVADESNNMTIFCRNGRLKLTCMHLGLYILTSLFMNQQAFYGP